MRLTRYALCTKTGKQGPWYLGPSGLRVISVSLIARAGALEYTKVIVTDAFNEKPNLSNLFRARQKQPHEQTSMAEIQIAKKKSPPTILNELTPQH